VQHILPFGTRIATTTARGGRRLRASHEESMVLHMHPVDTITRGILCVTLQLPEVPMPEPDRGCIKFCMPVHVTQYENQHDRVSVKWGETFAYVQIEGMQTDPMPMLVNVQRPNLKASQSLKATSLPKVKDVRVSASYHFNDAVGIQAELDFNWPRSLFVRQVCLGEHDYQSLLAGWKQPFVRTKRTARMSTGGPYPRPPIIFELLV
jgi:hypothetical protein